MLVIIIIIINRFVQRHKVVTSEALNCCTVARAFAGLYETCCKYNFNPIIARLSSAIYVCVSLEIFSRSVRLQ